MTRSKKLEQLAWNDVGSLDIGSGAPLWYGIYPTIQSHTLPEKEFDYTCEYCNTVLLSDQQFCPRCGAPRTKEKKDVVSSWR